MKQLLRFAIVAVVLILAPVMADAECKECVSVNFHVWCDVPATWGYENCTTFTRGNVVGCRNGLPMCYYMEVQG